MNKQYVMGVYAPKPRPTLTAAFILACIFAVPLGCVAWLVEWLWL